MKKITIGVILVLGILSAAVSGSCQEKWQVTLGAGATVLPKFEGADNYRAQILPFFDLRYGDRFFLSSYDGLGYNLAATDKLQAGPIVRYRFERNQDDDPALRGLGGVGPAVEAGGFLKYLTRYGQLSLEARKDIASDAQGSLIAFSWLVGNKFGEKLILAFGPKITWADDNYMETYFGINSSQAARSGYPAFKAGAGLKDAGITIVGQYRLSEKVRLFGLGSYKQLLNDAAKSPLVKEQGSTDQFQAALFLGYNF